MSVIRVDVSSHEGFCERPRRARVDTQRLFYGADPNQKPLELPGIIKVLQGYSDYDGGINCSICGKLYKSKVCFTKHLWEHSVYWDLFDGEKNHDRVLSIQAALILYNCNMTTEQEKELSFLLVTAPHHTDKKKERDVNGNEVKTPTKNHNGQALSPLKRPSPLKSGKSVAKRKRFSSSGSSGSLSSSSDTESLK